MKIVNKKARYNYFLLERIEAGVVLKGSEVKSFRQKKIRLDEGFVRIDDNGEVWLINAYIYPYQHKEGGDYNPTRSRKLLLKKKEILGLVKKMEAKNLTLVPTAMYDKKGKIKIEIALAKGKKKRDKREVIKKKEQDRKAREIVSG